MGRANGVLKQVLRKITPTPKERKDLEAVIDRAVGVTEKIIKPLALRHTLAGSFTRDTWMPDKKEFEIFILFPEDYPRERLEKMGLEIGKEIVRALKGSCRVAYAEHPYTRAKILGYDVDIVPCYKVSSASRIKSAVDRTPFHNKWISGHLPEKLSSDVRLLKQFTKAMGIYGSDARTLGLSGYLCELLIIHYGSFQKFVQSASIWEAGRIFIDLETHHKAGKVPKNLRERFRDQPLVVIDPVDPKRNVAAAFSTENFMKLVKASRDFLRNPAEGFFFRRPEKPSIRHLQELLKPRQTRLLALSFRRPDVIDDVWWPQLRRTALRLKDILEEYEFLVMGYDVWSEEKGQGIILLEMEVWKLPSIRRIIGPPVFIEDRSQEFLKKYKPLGKTWVESNRWVAEVKRQWQEADKKLKDSLSDPLKGLKAKGISSYIAKSVSGKKFRILKEKEILNLAKKSRDFGLFLKHYLEKSI
jgi:tRNA nucleotidyltransferase (CCA-adding enzyme)